MTPDTPPSPCLPGTSSTTAAADGPGDPDGPEALERALAGARATRAEQVLESHAPGTRRAYRSDWAGFCAWCARFSTVDPRIRACPADDATLSLWVGAMDEHRPATLARRLAAIRLHHARAGFAMPQEAYPATRAALAGHRRRHAATAPRRVRAATDPILRALADSCDPGTLIGLRNRALLLAGYDGAFRRAELVGIDAEHLERVPRGLLVRLPVSKADQQGRGVRVPLLERPGSPWCPVAALDAWQDARLRPAGPVFVSLHGARHVRTAGLQRLSDRAVARIIKSAAARAGLEGAFGGHSLRRGLVTSAIEAGVPIEQIMRHVRHRRLDTTLGYAEARTALDNHPGIGLGLSRPAPTQAPLPAPASGQEVLPEDA